MIQTGALILGLLVAACLLVPATADASARATLGWTDATGETGYKVERRSGGVGQPWNQIGPNLAANTISFVETGLAEGVEHCYRVKAFNSFDPNGVSTPELCQTGGSPSTPGGFFYNLIKE